MGREGKGGVGVKVREGGVTEGEEERKGEVREG